MKNAILSLILILFCSCSASFEDAGCNSLTFINDAPKHIVINPDSAIKGVDLSQVFDSVSFVKLSSDSNAIVTHINQIHIKDSLILISDRYGTGVKLFTLTGNLLCNVGNRGRGPGEFVEPTYVEFYDNTIVVWDQFSKKLLYYGLDGQFIKSYDINLFALKFHQFGPNQILFNNVNGDNDSFLEDYTLIACDSTSNVVSTGMYREKDSYWNFWADHDFFQKDSQVFYHPVYSDSIYTIFADNTIRPVYYLDFGQNSAPEWVKQGRHIKKIEKVQRDGTYCFLGSDFFISGDYLLFSYAISQHPHMCLFSNATGKLVDFNEWICPSFFPVQLMNISSSTDEAFVGYFFPAIYADSISELSDEDRDEYVKLIGKERTDLLYSMKNDDNAIITFFYPSI